MDHHRRPRCGLGHVRASDMLRTCVDADLGLQVFRGNGCACNGMCCCCCPSGAACTRGSSTVVALARTAKASGLEWGARAVKDSATQLSTCERKQQEGDSK
eukprot:1160468-Pelagomonas_calceolata.AAC.5